MGRNTTILQEIIGVLSNEIDDTEYALDVLESHFHDRLVFNACISDKPISSKIAA